MNSCTIIILGATGDLAKRKLIPALYHMMARGKLTSFALIGAARERIDAQTLLAQARMHIEGDIDERIWNKLGAVCYYQKVDFTIQEDFNVLRALVEKVEKEHQLEGNRLIHLACAAFFFCTITQSLALSGVAQKLDAHAQIWHRIIYEKPFGHNLQSAREINNCISQYFNEVQIYRIDHFLTKELVSNISLIRFTNCIFEPLWNNRFIDAVQIVLNESEGVNGRGAYYDQYGALRDVVQNHMLELLALIAMEPPKKLTGEYIREQRAEVLKKIQFVDGIRGQYKSYTQEQDVDPHSTTETFTALLMRVNTPRFAGVPFYLKTGKKLSEKKTAIHIKFKQVDCLLAKHCPSEPNYLTIRITPRPTFEIQLNVKKITHTDEVAPVTMEFCHSCKFGNLVPDAYEILYEEIMKGEQSISVRFDEIEYAWHVIDEIRSQQLPLYAYESGSEGPKELKDFAQKHGMRWQS